MSPLQGLGDRRLAGMAVWPSSSKRSDLQLGLAGIERAAEPFLDRIQVACDGVPVRL